MDLHTATTFNSSSSKFGSFAILASVEESLREPAGKSIREHSLIMLSSESGSGSETTTGSGGWRWWSIGSKDEEQPDDYDDQMFKVVDKLGGGGGGSNEDLVLKLDSLGVPSCYKSCFFFKQTVGSCNGLVCLYDRNPNKVCLWNPFTKKYRILPSPIRIGKDWNQHAVAFGFDVEANDYKVVLLTGFKSESYRPVSTVRCLCRVQIYSLSTDSWRLLEHIDSLPGDPFMYLDSGICLNGSCFFMTHFFHTKDQPCLPENDRFVISFDFTKEKIIIPIQLPDHHRDQKLYLSCLGDKLALFSVCYPSPPLGTYSTEYFDYDDCKIWVLNEHSSISISMKIKESWTELHSFKIQLKSQGECNIPVGLSNDGKFALIESLDSTGFCKKIKLYDLVSKEVKRNFLSCNLVFSKAIAYQPSLVSVSPCEKEQQQPPLALG